MKTALLLSTDFFEDFYEAHLGLTRVQYLQEYRNDWSWDWLSMLEGEGVSTSIYVATTGPAERATTMEGFQVRFLSLGQIAAPWVRAPILSRSPPGRWTGQIALALGFLRPLSAALAADEIDVLCVQEYWTGRFDVLTRCLDVPVVGVDQGLPDRREIKWLKRGSFARARGVVAQTEREVAKLRTFGADAARIPNAVRTDYYTPYAHPRGDEARRVVCVGRLHETQKRLSDVLHAVSMLPARDGWTIEIAGTGPDEPALRSLVRRLGIEDRVLFLGFMNDRAAIRDLYRSAALFALPSAYEGLPMVLLEAMSCGVTVVATDIPAIAEVVDHGRNGLLVPVADPPALARALQAGWERRDVLGPAARSEILANYDRAVVGPHLRAFLQAARTPPPDTVPPAR